MSALALASSAVETISRGVPGKANIKPNAINVTARAIEAGTNKTLDTAAQLIRNELRKEKDPAGRQAFATAISIVLALRYEEGKKPTAA